MSEHDDLIRRIHQLEYHQRLLMRLLQDSTLDFYKLVIEHGLSEQFVHQFYHLCDELSIKLADQKAEGYVYFHPLFQELSLFLPIGLNMEEVVMACLRQKLYEPLFQEFSKYI